MSRASNNEAFSLLTNGAVTGSAVIIPGGYYSWQARGTWAGATAQLQYSSDGTNWNNISGAALTADGGWQEIPIAAGYVRVLISGGPPSAVYSTLGGII